MAQLRIETDLMTLILSMEEFAPGDGGPTFNDLYASAFFHVSLLSAGKKGRTALDELSKAMQTSIPNVRRYVSGKVTPPGERLMIPRLREYLITLCDTGTATMAKPKKGGR